MDAELNLGIVIPVFIPPGSDKIKQLTATLDEVLSQKDGHEDQICIVDDGSQNQELNEWLLAFDGDIPEVTYLTLPPSSHIPPWRLASARNYAVFDRVSNCQGYVFLDMDCMPQPWWLDEYRDMLSEHLPNMYAPGIVGIVVYGRTDHEQLDGSIKPDPRVELSSSDNPRRAASLFERGGGGNMMVSYHIFYYLNGFDNQYDGGFGYEETDFTVRAYQAGAEVYYAPRAAVIHSYHPRDQAHFRGLDENRQRFQASTRLFAGGRK